MIGKFWSEKRQKVLVVMISTFLWGLVAHGYMLANKVSYHDDIYNLYYVGGTYGMGRWMLGIIGKICSILGGNYSLSWWNGLVSFFFIGVTCYLILELLRLEQKKIWILASGIMVVFPVIAGLFGYMFTSFPYMIGLCMGTLGVYLIIQTKELSAKSLKPSLITEIGIRVLGIVLICGSIGVYQPYFGFYLCLMLLALLQKGLYEKNATVKSLWQEALWDLGSALVSLLCYLVANRFFLALVHKEMYHYDGVENMGLVSLPTYLHRVVIAYQEFIMPAKDTVYDMYPMVMHGVYWVLLLLGVVISVKQIVVLWKKDRSKALTCGLFLLLLPLAVNFIFVLADVGSIYTLTMYGQVLQFVWILTLLENAKTSEIRLAQWKIICVSAGEILILFSIIWYTRYDNICYFKADLLQKRAISYFNSMITRIQEVEGYDEELPVAFIHPLEKKMPDGKIDEDLSRIHIMPYQDDTLINNYVWDMFMAEWCGYEPTIYDGNYVEQIMDLSDMPHYPAAGSIEVRDGIVIVNF